LFISLCRPRNKTTQQKNNTASPRAARVDESPLPRVKPAQAPARVTRERAHHSGGGGGRHNGDASETPVKGKNRRAMASKSGGKRGGVRALRSDRKPAVVVPNSSDDDSGDDSDDDSDNDDDDDDDEDDSDDEAPATPVRPRTPRAGDANAAMWSPASSKSLTKHQTASKWPPKRHLEWRELTWLKGGASTSAVVGDDDDDDDDDGDGDGDDATLAADGGDDDDSDSDSSDCLYFEYEKRSHTGASKLGRGLKLISPAWANRCSRRGAREWTIAQVSLTQFSSLLLIIFCLAFAIKHSLYIHSLVPYLTITKQKKQKKKPLQWLAVEGADTLVGRRVDVRWDGDGNKHSLLIHSLVPYLPLPYLTLPYLLQWLAVEGAETLVGRRVEVRWDGDGEYYAGRVTQHLPTRDMHLIRYENGEQVGNERSCDVRLCCSSAPTQHSLYIILLATPFLFTGDVAPC
jgi:hypothetical protein